MSGLTGNNILAGTSGQATGYDIERSVVIDTNSYFTRTPSSSSNRKTWTYSAWVKRSTLDNGSTTQGDSQTIFSAGPSSSQYFYLAFSSSVYSAGYDDTLYIDEYSFGQRIQKNTSQKFRDIGGWYHIVLAFDTTQATAANRIKVYVNGEQVTDWARDTNPSLNYESLVNHTNAHRLGSAPYGSGSGYWQYSGYISEVNFIDGQALTAASFGETNEDTNQWQAVKYAGSYGTHGFYLDFATRATDPIDTSGNGNNFSSVNVIAGDWKIDSPTNNFATLNPLDAAGNNNTFSEGNLKCVVAAQNTNEETRSTIGVSSGKWYWEFYLVSTTTTAGYFKVGLKSPDGSNYWNVRGSDGELDHDGSTGSSSVSYTTTNIVNVAVDMDSGKWWVGTNGSWVGDPSAGSGELHSGISGTVLPYILNAGSGGTHTIVSNFGQDSSFAGNKTAQGNGGVGEDFYYAPPTGYQALNTDNLPDPSIDDPTKHFNTALYVGTQSAGNSITNVGFKPDFVWLKDKDHAQNHGLFDVVRGVNKQIMSNSSVVEITAYSDLLTSFDTDGFTLGADLSVGDINHYSGGNYVSWSWKGGGTASSNSDGTITSSVSANTTAGFSIVSYTGNSTAGATVGHGLSQAPDLVIAKERTHQDSWLVFSESLGNTKALFLNETSASGTHTSYWNNTSPSSTVVTLGSDNKGNGSGTMIMYCFHSVDGYSKVGSYTGNGSTDGAFVYTSFKPQWLLVKETGAAGNWIIWDVKRSEFNVMNDYLLPNSTAANAVNAAVNVDFVSNGFKWRNSDNDMNGNGGSYIYLAIAESPFKYSNAR